MKKTLLAMVVAMFLLVWLAPLASAETITFVPGSAGVSSSINSGGGFFVAPNTYGLFGANAWTSDFSLNAGGPGGYSDAGLVFFLGGGLTLGQLQSVSAVSTGAPLAFNLWFDTGGDGKFFAFDAATEMMTGINNDSYAGCGAQPVSFSSPCYMLGGNGAGGSFTLAQLQAGLVAGITGNTQVAVWAGFVGGDRMLNAEISSVTVTTAPVPEPTSMMLLGTGLVGMATAFRRRRKK